jgi:hypothetical protein
VIVSHQAIVGTAKLLARFQWYHRITRMANAVMHLATVTVAYLAIGFVAAALTAIVALANEKSADRLVKQRSSGQVPLMASILAFPLAEFFWLVKYSWARGTALNWYVMTVVVSFVVMRVASSIGMRALGEAIASTVNITDETIRQ